MDCESAFQKTTRRFLFLFPMHGRMIHWSFALQEDEKIGFVFPIYSWAPPEIVLDFIRKLVFKEGYIGSNICFLFARVEMIPGLTQQGAGKRL